MRVVWWRFKNDGLIILVNVYKVWVAAIGLWFEKVTKLFSGSRSVMPPLNKAFQGILAWIIHIKILCRAFWTTYLRNESALFEKWNAFFSAKNSKNTCRLGDVAL